MPEVEVKNTSPRRDYRSITFDMINWLTIGCGLFYSSFYLYQLCEKNCQVSRKVLDGFAVFYFILKLYFSIRACAKRNIQHNDLHYIHVNYLFNNANNVESCSSWYIFKNIFFSCYGLFMIVCGLCFHMKLPRCNNMSDEIPMLALFILRCIVDCGEVYRKLKTQTQQQDSSTPFSPGGSHSL